MRSTLLLLVIIPIISFGQKTEIDIPVDKTTGKISFETIKNVEGYKSSQLLNLIHRWAATTTIIKNKKIEIADSSLGQIVIDATTPIYSEYNTSLCTITYSITVYTKDEKYKCLIRNFSHEGCIRPDGLGKMNSIGPLENIITVSTDRKYFDHVLKSTKRHSEEIIGSIENFIAANGKESDF